MGGWTGIRLRTRSQSPLMRTPSRTLQLQLGQWLSNYFYCGHSFAGATTEYLLRCNHRVFAQAQQSPRG